MVLLYIWYIIIYLVYYYIFGMLLYIWYVIIYLVYYYIFGMLCMIYLVYQIWSSCQAFINHPNVLHFQASTLITGYNKNSCSVLWRTNILQNGVWKNILTNGFWKRIFLQTLVNFDSNMMFWSVILVIWWNIVLSRPNACYILKRRDSMIANMMFQL